ncbi:MAG: GWxTD domain-containing protein [Candidatus Aminicenantes bacterium]|nr:GWxTD domain-containing protein [Candidatus Aminicenantes bacterium]
MKKNIFAVYISLLLFSGLLCSQEKVKEKDLPEKHREFLKVTSYIMLKQEKDVFLQLTSSRDRDAFIETFWKQRDPTPGTPKNEYKEEHMRRFLHANKIFSRGSVREGWMTDKGRYYILLGEPTSTEKFYGTLGIYPCEVWYYYGDPSKGLPSYFGLIFYQRGGTGEFKLYDPVSDGPSRLLIQSKGFAMEDYESMYERIREIAPTLADISLSLIPGDIPFNYMPSPRNTILIAEILESPKKDVNPSYATHFLSYKGIVNTEYMTNMIESETITALMEDPFLGINFLHFSLVPKTLSVDYYENNDQYYCNFTLDLSLRKEEEIIFQYRKEFPHYFEPKNIDRIRANGIAIEDSIPVADGQYKLVILLTNSVGKEFCIYEEMIDIKADDGKPRIIGPFLGYDFYETRENVHVPFKLDKDKLFIDPRNTFAVKDQVAMLFSLTHINQDLWQKGLVQVRIEGMKPGNPSIKAFRLELKNYPYRRVLSFPYKFSASELTPDYYRMWISLVDGDGQTVDKQTSRFIVTRAEAIAHPIARVRLVPYTNNYLFHYMLAHQYTNLENFEKADEHYEKAYNLKKDYSKGLLEYVNFLILRRNFTRSLELVDKLAGDENLKFEYLLAKGRTQMGLGQYAEAIENLLQANELYDSDIRVLNSLGFCYHKVGQRQKALDVLKASLSLNPKQDSIQKMIEEIENKR